MPDIDKFFSRADVLLERLEKYLPTEDELIKLNGATANRWRHENGRARLQEVKHLSQIRLEDLQCLDRQKQIITQKHTSIYQWSTSQQCPSMGAKGYR